MSVTTITTTTDGVHALCFAGQRALVKLSGGNLLLVYADGTDLASREGSGASGLASASKKTIIAGEYKSPVNSTLLSNGEWFGYEATNNPSVYGRYAYTPLPTATWASLTVGSGSHMDATENARAFLYNSSGTNYLHLQVGYWSNYAAGDGVAYVGDSQMGSNGGGGPAESSSNYVQTAYGTSVLRVAYDSANWKLWWDVNDPLTAQAGTAFPGATVLETDTAGTSNFQDNLCAVTDTSGNAWFAWQDGSGIAVRCLPAGIGSPTNSSFATKVYVDTSATADLPNLFQDKAGNVYVVWKSSDANQDIQAQKLTYSSGISKVGGVITLSSGAATRQRLSCIEADSSNLYAVWVEGTASPYNIVAATYAIGGATDNLSAEVPQLATPSATLSVAHTLSAAIPALGSPVATLTLAHNLSATVPPLALPAATLSLSHALSSEIPALSAPSAALFVAHSLSAETPALASPQVTVTDSSSGITATIPALAGPSVSALAVAHSLTLEIPAPAGPLASLALTHLLSGETPALGSIGAALSIVRAIGAEVSGLGSIVAALTLAHSLSATVPSLAGPQATLMDSSGASYVAPSGVTVLRTQPTAVTVKL